MPDITERQLFDFVYREARLLDEQRFDEWLSLFTEDGFYWMPLTHDQPDARLHTSLMYEDKLLLQVRIERLNGRRTFSQQPKSRCHHLLSQPTIERFDVSENAYSVRAAFHYVETRLDHQQLYAGWSTFELVTDEQRELRIKLKRVDLVNCDAAHDALEVFI